MNPDLTQFLYKVAASAAVGVVMGIILWPVRKVHKEWIDLKKEQSLIHAELVQQRTNHLTHIEEYGKQQIELLGKTVAALDGVRLELASQTGFLSAMAAQPLRIRRAAAKK